MSDIPPPAEPGMYADANGAWWYWDGASWTPAPSWGPVATAGPGRHDQERSQAMLMWILYLVLGGWIAALIFYLISKEKPFTRHHAAEALNLTIVLLIPQVAAMALLVPDYLDLLSEAGETDPSFELSPLFFVGLGLLFVLSIVNLGLSIAGAVMAHRGRWYRLPIGLHPVRGVVRKGEAPPYDVSPG